MAYGRVTSAIVASAATNTTIPSESKALPLRTGSPSAPPTVHHGRTQPTRITIAPTAARRRDRPTGRRCMLIDRDPSFGGRVDLGSQHADEPQVPVELAIVEAVADHELVGDREARVVDIDLDESPRRLVEQRADPQRRGLLAAEVADEVVQRQARVDDV